MSQKFTVTATNSAGEDSIQLTLSTIVPPEISTAKLKNAKLGKSYSVTLKTRKGTKPFTWTAEGLPNGLSIAAKTGRISGKPSEAGTFSVTFTAENDGGSYARTLNLIVKGIEPRLSGSLAKAELNKPYSSGLKLSKGSQPIAWSIEGALPDGLNFDATTGIISGIPTSYGKGGKFKLTITATNTAGEKSKSAKLIVKGKAPKIKISKLPDATEGSEYSVKLETSAGSDPITWRAEGLPDGLRIEGDTIKGIPTVSGKKFTVKIYASNPVKEVKKSLSLAVNAKSNSLPVNTTSENEVSTLRNDSEAVDSVGENVTETVWDEAYGSSEGYVIVAELGTISADEAGMYEFGFVIGDDVPEGLELLYIANSDNPSEDDEIAEFYDDTGTEISVVPESRNITVSVWLNEGVTYSPEIAVKK